MVQRYKWLGRADAVWAGLDGLIALVGLGVRGPKLGQQLSRIEISLEAQGIEIGGPDSDSL